MGCIVNWVRSLSWRFLKPPQGDDDAQESVYIVASGT